MVTQEKLFDSDRDFSKALMRLNALSGMHQRWQGTVARCAHTDLLGRQIQAGETYYSREFYNTIRLSRLSMEAVLYAAVATSPNVEALADDLLAEDVDQLRHKVRP